MLGKRAWSFVLICLVVFCNVISANDKNSDQKLPKEGGPLPEATSVLEAEGSATGTPNSNHSGSVANKTVVAPEHPSASFIVPSSGALTVSSSEIRITPSNEPDIKKDPSKVSIDPVETSTECNSPAQAQPPTDAPTSKVSTASTCDCTTANTEATTSSSAPKDNSEITSEAPPDDDLFPSAPPGESEESVASISIFFMTVLLGICVILVHLFIKFKFHYLPESIAFVFVGCVVGGVLLLLKKQTDKDYLYQETLSPQSFFLVLLPPIIFESGYSLHKGNFFQNLGSIIVFAVIGTSISAAIVGGGLYGLGMIGVIYKLDLIQSFTFGSLISAVDPVATLAIFHALDVDPTLNMLVFGESVLNDAVSIVLTKTILNQLPSNISGGDMDSNTTAAVVLGNSAWQFCVMFFGSAFLGVGTALVSALFLKHVNVRRLQSLEFTMWLSFAFGPYFLAEGLHLSGIMTVLFSGIVMSHYTHYNLTPGTQVTVQQALRTVAFMAETVVFLYLGLALFSINQSFDLALIVWSLILILIGRALNIFPLTALMNCCRSVKISLRMQCIMWYSGLRGAVAFALAENLREYFDSNTTSYIVTTTLIIVLFTIIILGGSTLPLLKFLKADKGTRLTLSKTEEQGTAVSGILPEESGAMSVRQSKNCSQGFAYLDYKYLRPLFIRKFTRQEVRDAQIEMKQKTDEWYQGLRGSPLSEDEHSDGTDETSTMSTLLTSM